jgi:hypothetical protein
MLQQQSILDTLISMGFGDDLNWNDLSSFNPTAIKNRLRDHFGLEDEDLPSTLFQSITPEMMQGASYSTYAPQISSQGQSMLPDLYKNLGGQVASQAAGGLAGSGSFQQQQTGVRDVYGKEMSNIISNVGQQHSRGVSLISDLIGGWKEAAQRIKGLQ